MNNRAERDLRTCPTFADVPIWDNRENMPWPKRGDSLLSNRIGAEAYVFPYDEWIPDELERLGFFAMLFVDRARDLVREWLETRDKPENFVYAVGYLYRHAIELELKAAIARSEFFRSKNMQEQRALLNDHSIHRLWLTLKVLIARLADNGDIDVIERQLLELHRLDERSDGFRYPFRFVDQEGHRQSLLGGLRFKSFDNLVWVLDGLGSWLSTLQDMEQLECEYEVELARGAGW
jgi:hypothetical protein